MVLASGFRGSMLRLPLSGMVYCEIATRTLDLRACNPRRGRREDRAVKKCQSLMSRPQKRTGGRVFIPPWQDNASLSARVPVGERRKDRLKLVQSPAGRPLRGVPGSVSDITFALQRRRSQIVSIQSRHYDLADVTSVAGSVPRRNARFFNSKKNTGTRMRTWIVEVTMP